MVHTEHLSDQAFGFERDALRHVEHTSADLGEEVSLVLSFERVVTA